MQNKIILSTVIVFSVLFACGTSSSDAGHNLEDLTLEIQRRACETRLDTLLFQINGIVYELEGNISGGEMIELLSDSQLVCPVFDIEYQIDYDHKAFLIICPNGHGGIAASLE